MTWAKRETKMIGNKPRTDGSTRPETSGFTLIEVMVVLTVLLLFVSLVTPKIVSQQSARQKRESYNQVLRLAMRGREEAILNGQTYQLQYRDGSGQVALVRQPVSQSTVTAAAPTADSAAPEDVSSVTLPQEIRGSVFQLEGNSVEAADWKVSFFPDGKSEGGTAELVEGNAIRTLVIGKDGSAKLQDGQAPQGVQDQWQAGELEHRQ